jgi:murein L,D-transpeptidase YcbB/YkuD
MILSALTAKALLVVAAAGIISSSQPVASMASRDYLPPSTFGEVTLDSLLLRVSFSNALEAGAFEDTIFSDAPGMREFYKNHGNMPFWLGDTFHHPRIEAILPVLKASWKHGLNPHQYHVDEIQRLLRHPVQSEQAHLELLVSDAVVRFGEDLTGMRIEPKAIKQKSKYWREKMRGFEILEYVVSASDPGMALEEFAPQGKLYKKLVAELVRLSEEPVKYDHILPINLGSNYFKPGDYHKDIIKLRLRMGVKYDPVMGAESKYDDQLAAEIMKFQKQHGVEPDGILGPKTMALVNRTRADRMEQIIANLERLRWLEQDRPDRYVLVNIPSATVWGVENGVVKLEMPVVVGMSYRPTKSFKAEISGVRFNPTWTIPHSLKYQDILPKVRKDIGYLEEKGIQLFKGYGRNAISLDPYAIDWDNMTWGEIGKIRMVQEPGDHNALGRVRVLMDNPYNIYMHDTNHKEFFSRNERNLSSGCIRLSDPIAMANFILNVNEDWSEKNIDELLSHTDTIEIDAVRTMPVYILYQTTWLDNKGELVFGHDIYKQDKKLIKALASIDGIFIPDQADTLVASAQSDPNLAPSRQ